MDEIATILSMVLGTAGLTLSLVNYWDNHPRVKVTLVWDMKTTDEDDDSLKGLITIANIGKRPIFVSHVALRLPDGF